MTIEEKNPITRITSTEVAKGPAVDWRRVL
jgi:hypothetical protein